MQVLKKLFSQRYLGITLILSGLLIVLYVVAPIAYLELSYQLHKNDYSEYVVATSAEDANAIMASQGIAATQVLVPKSTEFGIVVPKINANERIVVDVDVFDEEVYQSALSQGVAQASGSGLPGSDQGVFLFAHSSADFITARRFNAQFYLLSKLEKGDKIYVFYKNEAYIYEVTNESVVDPSAVDYVTQGDKDQLTLMTCYPAGTNHKRLLVFAKRI